MKCPVCSSELKAKEATCPICGFDDIRHEFINDEELRMWQNYVVKPCKYAYRLNFALRKEVSMLRREVAKLGASPNNANGNHGANGSTSAPPPAQPKAQMADGWNYDDPIAHPNSAECTYFGVKSNVYNIKSEMAGSSTAIISFVIQKTQDAKGKNSTDMAGARYRVKDADGVIVLNEMHRVNGLRVGDASRETIKLNGVAAGRYSIDFVDY